MYYDNLSDGYDDCECKKDDCECKKDDCCEGGGKSKKTRRIEDIRRVLARWLNDDLRHELQHLHFYLHAGVMVQGLWRQEISEYLLSEAASELKHCEEFARKVVWLGEIPAVCPKDFPAKLTRVTEILEFALKMEGEVVERYTARLNDIEQYVTLPEAKAVQLFYENQLLDSHETVMNIQELLRPFKN